MPGGFNSRTPGGVRRLQCTLNATGAVFQFTHPRRGATLLSAGVSRSHTVSIHAPQEGCDYAVVMHITNPVKFQFTHPRRGATVVTLDVFEVGMVSIHAPQEGCDLSNIIARLNSDVSIHAPQEGCDVVELSVSLHKVCFNSRTPGGVRLNGVDYRTSSLQFQFTHPRRGATRPGRTLPPERFVSIHAPQEGCDGCCSFGTLWY